MKLVQFTIEMRHPDTGFWEIVLPIKPNYKLATIQTSAWRFPWLFSFVWTTPKILNEEDAKLNARKRAILHGRSYWHRGRRPGVRIMKWEQDRSGFDFVSTVWEDGKFLDC
jgi:hypothetical protein